MFTLGVFPIIFDDQNRILLAHRTDRDMWNLPGGSVESHESPWQAVVREVKEEIDVAVTVLRLVSVHIRMEENHLSFAFECRIISGEIQTSPEADQVKYFALSAIPLNTALGHVLHIQDAFSPYLGPILSIREGKSSIELQKDGTLEYEVKKILEA